MQIKVSIIVPIYDVEQYLRDCLDSLINQTLRDIEIICINDCSPDNCLEIIKEYQQKDSRIKLIDHEINKGVSVARNNGINMATGEYIGFCDPDDYLDLNFYELLYTKAKEGNIDIVGAGMLIIKNANALKNKSINKNTTLLIKPSKNKFLFIYNFCSAIYRTSFLEENKIDFPSNIFASEDIVFSIKNVVFAKTFDVVDNTFYNCRRRTNSANSDIFNLKKIENINSAAELIFNLLNDYNSLSYINKENYNILFSRFYLLALFQLFNKTTNEEHRTIISKKLIEFYSLHKYKTIFIETLNNFYPELYKYLESNNVDGLKEYYITNYGRINKCYNIKILNFISFLEIYRYRDESIDILKINLFKYIQLLKINNKKFKKYIYLFFIKILTIKRK